MAFNTDGLTLGSLARTASAAMSDWLTAGVFVAGHRNAADAGSADDDSIERATLEKSERDLNTDPLIMFAETRRTTQPSLAAATKLMCELGGGCRIGNYLSRTSALKAVPSSFGS